MAPDNPRSEYIVLNELLAFVQNHITVLSDKHILEVCAKTFDEEAIYFAKGMLARHSKNSVLRYFTYTTNKEEVLGDIIRAIKETYHHDVPKFVAADLHKLPRACCSMCDKCGLDFKFDYATFKQMQEEVEFMKSFLKAVMRSVGQHKPTAEKETNTEPPLVKMCLSPLTLKDLDVFKPPRLVVLPGNRKWGRNYNPVPPSRRWRLHLYLMNVHRRAETQYD